MGTFQQIKNDIKEAVSGAANKPSLDYDTTAEVVRVEGNTAWVHIPGGVDETPVEMSVNAKAGDTVRVRVSDGQAFLNGNNTAPPTDDTKANAVEKKAEDLAKNARRFAIQEVTNLDKSLSAEELFNRITDNGAAQGIYMDDDGNIYINAEYIASGTISADRISANSISVSKLTGSISNGNWKIDLDAGTFTIGNISANNITSGTMSANRISGGTIQGSSIIAGGNNDTYGTIKTVDKNGRDSVVIKNTGIVAYANQSGGINDNSGSYGALGSAYLTLDRHVNNSQVGILGISVNTDGTVDFDSRYGDINISSTNGAVKVYNKLYCDNGNSGIEEVWHPYNFPKSHASSASTYGLGTTANYGHVKTINSLTQSSHSDGTALSAYQGYVLNWHMASGDFAVRFKTGSIAIADGTSTTKTVTINISSSVPSGYGVWGVQMMLGNYHLPYINPAGTRHTFVTSVTNTTVTIENTSTSWGTVTYYMIIWLHKT